MPVSAFDVAAFIRRKVPYLTRMKLQKLLYYAQAWSMVWDKQPLFEETIEAWELGPVVRSVWAREKHDAESPRGNGDHLTPEQRATIMGVIEFYGKYDGDMLSEFTHCEAPWRLARRGLDARAHSRAVIDTESLALYYGQVGAGSEKRIPDSYGEALMRLTEMSPEVLDELMADMTGDDTPLDVDVAGHLRFLETGIGTPWPTSSS